MQRSPGPQLEAARFQTEAPKVRLKVESKDGMVPQASQLTTSGAGQKERTWRRKADHDGLNEDIRGSHRGTPDSLWKRRKVRGAAQVVGGVSGIVSDTEGEHLIFVTPATNPGLGARTIMRKVAQTGMTFSKSECKQPKAWHQPVEQPSTVTVDEYGDEQMVPAVGQGPPTKKVAMPGVPIPSAQREVDNPGGSNCLFFAISHELLQCAIKAPHNIIKAKEVTMMRKKAKEFEEKWDGDRPQASQERCGIFGVYLKELTVWFLRQRRRPRFSRSRWSCSRKRKRTCPTGTEPGERSS